MGQGKRSQPQCPRRRLKATSQFGLALPVVLIIISAVAVGAASLISYSSSGLLGAARRGEDREAREAAEAGMAIVISELNKQQNRKMLVADVPINSWSSSDLKLRNPCTPTVNPSATAVGFQNNSSNAITGSNGDRRFVVKTIELKNWDRSRRFTSSAQGSGPGGTTGAYAGTYDDSLVNLTRDFSVAQGPDVRNVGYIEVTIEGQAFRNGNQFSTARITREFQVVPKCCSLSFGLPGNAHGNDNRICNAGSSLPRILVGLSGGGFNDPGTAQELRVQNSDGTTGTGQPPSVLCITQDQTLCGSRALPQLVDGVPVQPIEISLPPLPQYPIFPSPTDGFTIISNSAADDAASPNAKDYLRVSASGKVQLCNTQDSNPTTSAGGATGEPILSSSFVSGVSSCDDTIDNFCTATDAGTPQVAYHCRIRKLEVSDDTVNTGEDLRKQNNTFVIDSSRGPIYLYFNQAWNPPSPVAWTTSKTDAQNRTDTNIGIVTVDNWDDGQIQHVRCTTPDDGQPCTTKASPDDSSRVALFSDQNIVLAIGDDGFLRDVFTYLPRGELNLRPDPDDSNNAFGLPNYRGSAWLDRLTMGNSSRPGNTTQFAVPPLSLAFNSPFPPLIFEWVARSVSSNSLF